MVRDDSARRRVGGRVRASAWCAVGGVQRACGRENARARVGGAQRRDAPCEATLAQAADFDQVVHLRPLADDVVQVLFARVDEAHTKPALLWIARVVGLVLGARAARRVPILVVDPVGTIKRLIQPYESRAWSNTGAGGEAPSGLGRPGKACAAARKKE